jgi:hypothetical protein
MSEPIELPPTPPLPLPMPMQPVGYPVYLVQPSPPRGMSIASMVLGLVSILFGFTFFLPLTGLILGIIGARREPTGRGMAVTGIVLNSLILAGWVIVVLFIILVGVIGTGAALTSIPNR